MHRLSRQAEEATSRFVGWHCRGRSDTPRRMRPARLSVLLVFLAGCAGVPLFDPVAQAGSPPTITQQPVDQEVPRLGTVTFAVKASGDGPLTYQWYRNSEPWPEWDKRSLVLTRVTENNIGTYTVTVTNAAGTTTSAGARLMLVGSPPPPLPPPPPPPTLTARPAPSAPAAPPPAARGGGASAPSSVPTEYVREGEALQFVVTAEGAPPLHYIWFQDGRVIKGATTERLEIKAVRADHAGSYACIVWNSGGERASLPIQVVVRER